MKEKSVTPETELWKIMNSIITSTWTAQCACIIAKLKIPDYMSDGSKSIEEIARFSKSDINSLFRIMRLLTEKGLFTYDTKSMFSLTELGKTLQSDHPHSLLYSATYLCSNYHWASWGNLLYSLQTGQPAFNKIYGKDFFSFLDENREEAFVFNECMKQRDKNRINNIVDYYDFSKYKTIVDIGGGKGELISEILKRNTICTGVLFDKTNVTAEAYNNIKNYKLLDRCQIVDGDFFDAVPKCGDTYILSSILHDWDDEKALLILQNCRQTLSKSQKLIIIEKLLDDQFDSYQTKAMDIEMMLIFGGKERTLQEYKNLLSKAGLQIITMNKLDWLDILECELA